MVVQNEVVEEVSIITSLLRNLILLLRKHQIFFLQTLASLEPKKNKYLKKR